MKKALAILLAAASIVAIAEQFIRPVDPAEAQAAWSMAAAQHTGDQILVRRFGEEDRHRLPLHSWMLERFGWKRARAISGALLFFAAASALMLASKVSLLRFLVPLVILLAAVGVRASPAVLLAALLLSAISFLCFGRRHELFVARWWLPPLLGGAASLVWAPSLAILLLLWVGDWFSAKDLGKNRRWAALIGPVVAVAMIALWQIPYSRLAEQPLGWFERWLHPLPWMALVAVAAVLAAAFLEERIAAAVAVVALLLTLNVDQPATKTQRLDDARPVVVDRRVSDVDALHTLGPLPQASRRAGLDAALYLGPDGKREIDSAEGWSLLGVPLERPELPPEVRHDFEQKLRDAIADEAANPNDALAGIWVGRRLAYLGRYRDAIDQFNELTLRFPQDSRVWRHRGHRWISLRQFDRAIADLTRASQLEAGREDRVEPDGLPNAAGIPVSTTQTNIDYHLGLALYLSGRFEEALPYYERGLAISPNDDMWIAFANWAHHLYRRLGDDEKAQQLCDRLNAPFSIIENDDYLTLLRLYCGDDWEALLGQFDRDNVTLAYGIARYLRDRDREQAQELYDAVLEGPAGYSFGAIAAEAEVARPLSVPPHVAW